MHTYLQLSYEHDEPLPPGEDGEVRTPPALVERLLETYTDPGDRVLDPFAGFGTTLRVAESLDRAAYGVEYEADRVAYVRERVAHPGRVVHGSALELPALDVPPVACCLTSPPFMVEGMDVDPLQNYEGDSDYGAYLEDLRTTFAGVGEVAAAGAVVLVDVVNVKHVGEVTRLAWDVADVLAEVLHFEGELVVTWEGEGPPDSEGAYGYGYDHSYVLVFRNERGDGGEDGRE